MKHTHLLWEIFWSDKALVPSEILFARALHNEAEQKPFFLKDLCVSGKFGPPMSFHNSSCQD